MNQALQLAVLGKPQLTHDTQSLTADLVSAKGQALLIYLAVTGRSHSRTALAGLLWGDMPEETARANLRLTLSKLRKVLPETILQADRLEIGLVDYWLDVREFAERLEIGDSSNLQSLISNLQSPSIAVTFWKISMCPTRPNLTSGCCASGSIGGTRP